MTVGDLVRQNNKLIEFKGRGPRTQSSQLGVVIDIVERIHTGSHVYTQWGEWLGRSVTVLWTNGKMTESIAESALEVVSASR